MMGPDVKVLAELHKCKKSRQVGAAEGDAAFGRGEVRRGDVHEYGAASAATARQVVVADDDDKIVKVIVTPKPFSAGLIRMRNRTVVISVAGSIAPAIRGTDER